MALKSELEAGAEDASALPDGPSLDYVMRYPAPTEDDPDDPGFAASAAMAALMEGPDLHAALEPTGGPDEPAGGSLLEQLRQRALSGSSDEEEEEEEGREWRSMDIPALLLSRHHAAALRSLSSAEEDTAAAPDFADLTLAHEAEMAAQAAAALVPPELQPLARAANLLGYHTDHGRLAQSAAVEPPLHLQANRFAGLPEPLTAEQLEAAAVVVNHIAPAAGLVWGSAAATSSSRRRRGGTAVRPSTAAAVALVAEEGVEWLDAGRPAARGEGPQGSLEQEDRSLQLRRPPCRAASEAGMDASDRERVATTMAREWQEADGHIVHSQ